MPEEFEISKINFLLMVFGTSTGGLNALTELLSKIDDNPFALLNNIEVDYCLSLPEAGSVLYDILITFRNRSLFRML